MTLPCLVVIAGIVISAFYVYYDRIDDPKDLTSRTDEKALPTNLVQLDPQEAFKLQYEQIDAGIRSRDNMTSVGGTILITASILLLTSCAELASRETIDFYTRAAVVIASLAIYSMWLLGFDLTTDRVNNICYSKLRKMEMEAKPRLYIHSDMREKLRSEKWYNLVRRKIWLYLFWVLILLSVAILKMP